MGLAPTRTDAPTTRSARPTPSNALFWVALLPGVPAAAVVALGAAVDSAALRWLGGPAGVATGVLLTWWLSRAAVDRLAAKAPDLLVAMKTGRTATATRVGAGRRGRAKPQMSRREAAIALLPWIFGILALVPQGLVPLIMLTAGAW
ncbi:MAG TPA: hypothetical protein VGN37_11795 [Actinocatenispora sp.]